MIVYATGMPKWRFDNNLIHGIVGGLALLGLVPVSWLFINVLEPLIDGLAILIWGPLIMWALVLCGGVILRAVRHGYSE